MSQNKEKYQELFADFASKKVLIIGDVMVDAYLEGSVDRISPEAPVPVVALSNRDYRLGGAANVALNIQSLGAEPIICSVIGDDEKGRIYSQLLKDKEISDHAIIRSTSRKTTIKYRVLGNHVQMLRIDEESTQPLDPQETKLLMAKIEQLLKESKIDVVVFQDYDKGCITPEIIENTVKLANALNIPTCVDPKKRNFLLYKNVSLFKPNLKELREGLKIENDLKDLKNLEAALVDFQKLQAIDMLFTTLSADGVCLLHDHVFEHYPAHLRHIADVSGAGDTVISVAALCLACKTSPSEMAQIANLAGGLVCEYVGVVPVPKKQFIEEVMRVLL